jgi:hypothetical protein
MLGFGEGEGYGVVFYHGRSLEPSARGQRF